MLLVLVRVRFGRVTCSGCVPPLPLLVQALNVGSPATLYGESVSVSMVSYADVILGHVVECFT
jgi:hypothetical protein